tara:strand:+ start:101 stop:442 length:342 start_codon:yes stop_codon:yes gene_type:complete
MTNEINYSDFKKIDIRLGTIIEAKENNLLNKPSIVLKIDFGTQLGIKKSSAQIKSNYRVDQLINKQVVAVTNFKPKQVGKVLSEVLVLGFPDSLNEPVLVNVDKKLKNGVKLY